MRVGVFGTGSMGRNHVRLLSSLPGAELVGIYDPNPAAAEAAARDHGARVFPRLEDLAGEIEAAVVAAPTVAHADMGCELLGRGLHLLIEKPLAASLQEADRLLAQAGGRVLAVGHVEFFNPAVQALLSVGSPPRFVEIQRLGVFSPRSLDVDVVLDLMIHDLDIVLTLVGAPVREVRAVGLPVLSKKVDIANVRLEFENGCVANFTASRVSTERVRKMRFFQPHQYLSLDFARQDLLMIDVTAAAGLDLAQLAAMTGTGGHPSAGMSLRKVPVEPGEPLRIEIESFLNAVRKRTKPEVTLEEGRAALALALEINAAVESHARRTGLISR